MKTKEENQKKKPVSPEDGFDTVKTFRKIKNKISKDLQGMSFDEIKEYFKVYEHLTFDDNKHFSASKFPGLAERAIVCASFGKTFHNTGWKTGYCVVPSELMKEIRKIHQLAVFCVNHPVQRAFAEYLKEPEHYLRLGNFYQQKRDLFLKLIKGTKWKGKASQGTYFQVLDFSEITNEGDVQFVERLVKDFGLATIPVSVFNINKKDNKQLRFCFAKTDETLEKAAEILHRF